MTKNNGWTNRGKFNALNQIFRNTGAPTNYFVALVTSATAPDNDTNTLGDLTQIATGNGYTDGGFSLTRNATDFDVLTEVDAGSPDLDDYAFIQIKDVAWTASGGNIPSSGDGARYAVLTDDNGTVASREVFQWWDLSSDRTVSDSQVLTLQDLQIDIRDVQTAAEN
ncbi:MAG: hypothetical protein ACYS8I_13825 [Planctomycetota bacterium]|jgi:hypothetical protein